MGMEDGGKGTQDLGRLLVFEWMVGLIYLCSRTSHSSDEEAEGQRGKTTALKSHRTKIRGQFSWVSSLVTHPADLNLPALIIMLANALLKNHINI